MATGERQLRRGEWIELAILGVPTFAFALAITTVSTYLPVLASSFASSTTVIGALIGWKGSWPSRCRSSLARGPIG